MTTKNADPRPERIAKATVVLTDEPALNRETGRSSKWSITSKLGLGGALDVRLAHVADCRTAGATQETAPTV
jgi:hypothetical protein